jgi:hypothetical protein
MVGLLLKAVVMAVLRWSGVSGSPAMARKKGAASSPGGQKQA